MREYEVADRLKKELEKLFKKDPRRYQATLKKMQEILDREDVSHYKNLRSPLQHLKRVHIDSHFVLTFSYEKEMDVIRFTNLKHHDDIYKQV